MTLTLVPRSETQPIQCRYSPRLSPCCLFCAFGTFVMYICKCTRKLMSIHSRVPAPPITVSWGSLAWIRHVVHPRRGAAIIDHHNCVFSGKGCCVALIRHLIDFHALGERPRGHEILQHAVVPELALDGVGMVGANLFKDVTPTFCIIKLLPS
jgi:hypothetical protein